MKCDRLTVRLKPHQMQVLREMREKMGVSCSLIVRSIICDFLERNEDSLERIMDKNNEDADN